MSRHRQRVAVTMQARVARGSRLTPARRSPARSPRDVKHYREIVAKHEAYATCGHTVQPRDVIGWDAEAGETVCRDCWEEWTAKAKQTASKA